MYFEGEDFVYTCWYQEWDEVRKVLTHSPHLLWIARDADGHTPAFWMSRHGEIEMLKYAYSVINSHFLLENREQHLRDTFERTTKLEKSPLSIAVQYGHANCIEFLIRHCPSGPNLLEKKVGDKYPIHLAIENGTPELVTYIVENCPSGRNIFEKKTETGETCTYIATQYGNIRIMEMILRYSPSALTTLKVSSLNKGKFNVIPFQRYFTPKKLLDIAFYRELDVVAEAHHQACSSAPEPNSLVSIVFTILGQEIETQIYRNQ